MNTQPVVDVRGRWQGGSGVEEALAPLAEINARCLELLCAMAQSAADLPPLLADRRRAWCGLTPGAREHLATVPWLLVDSGCGDELRWRRYAGAVRDQAGSAPEPPFFGRDALDFIRHVLVYSWHVARSQPQLARLALGMSAACCARLAALRLAELDTLAECCRHWVRPRWENSPAIWRALLRAAADEDRRRIVQAGQQGILLLAAGALGESGRRELKAPGSARCSA